MLNSKQQYALNCMMHGKNMFITGDAGTGKSYVVNKFIDDCKLKNKQIIVCAPTGIAAINIGGVTAHRIFKIPIKPLIESPRAIPTTLKDADVILIDEVSMLRIDVFEYIATVLFALNSFRRQRGLDDIQVVLVGDFFQLPPVITDKDREVLEKYKYGEDLGKGFAFQSKYWDAFNFVCVQLDEVVRQDDKVFIQNLNYIRYGDYRGIRYFNEMSKKHEIKDAILVCGTNKAVNQKNEAEYKKIKNKEFIYDAEIDGEVAESDKIVPDKLKLKVGCRVMTVINDYAGKYQNGTLATVTYLDEEKIIILTDDGEQAEIEPYTWDINNYSANNIKSKVKIKLDCIGTYTQYPLRLAYAVTVHKSQGQTFDKVNLNPYCWDCGQLYVALSRVRNINGLYLTEPIRASYLIASSKVKEFYMSIRNFLKI